VLSVNEPQPNSFNYANTHAIWQNQVLGRQLQMTQYQNQFTAATFAMAELSRQGTLFVGQRQSIAQEYEKATGILLDKSADLKKWSTRLTDHKSKLQAKAAKAPGGKVPTTFAGYLPFDLDAERDRVLRDLGVNSST